MDRGRWLGRGGVRAKPHAHTRGAGCGRRGSSGLSHRNSGHDAWVNSRTLAAAGITAASADPPNGRIERDALGQPTGLLHEDTAMDLVVPLIPPKSAAEQLADLKAALHEMTRLGSRRSRTPWRRRRSRPLSRRSTGRELWNSVSISACRSKPEKDDETQVRAFLNERTALSGRWLRATCVKLFIDGAAAHTVALLQPYSDAPALGRGNLFIEQARLNRLVARLDAAGFRATCTRRAIGRCGPASIPSRRHDASTGFATTGTPLLTSGWSTPPTFRGSGPCRSFRT